MQLEELVKSIYAKALAEGEVIHIQTTVETVWLEGIPFQIRVAPSLKKKPTGQLINKDADFNPFLPYNPALFVTEFTHHNVLLNKFSVVPWHLLITTKDFQKQTAPPLPDDCEAVWRIISEFKSQPMLAFYNCGELSGASQKHKHFQIIPLPHREISPPISQILNNVKNKKPGNIYSSSILPYVHVFTFLDTSYLQDISVSGEYLSSIFFSLYDCMVEQLRISADGPTGSYNFLLTHEWMMLVPRSKAEWIDEKSGLIAGLNSMSMAGMILVKSEEELEILKNAGLLKVLKAIGIERDEVETGASTLSD